MNPIVIISRIVNWGWGSRRQVVVLLVEDNEAFLFILVDNLGSVHLKLGNSKVRWHLLLRGCLSQVNHVF